MSTAHVCLRSALSQAFRPSHHGIAASYSVASFLVPCLNRPSRRNLSATRHCRQTPEEQSTITSGHDHDILHVPSKPRRQRPLSSITLPAHDERSSIEKWLAALEPYLPIELRQTDSELPDVSASVTAIDLAVVINVAQASNLDILSHLSIHQGRWSTAVWIAKKLVGERHLPVDTMANFDLFRNVQGTEIEQERLDQLTETPLLYERRRPPQKLDLSLDDLTSVPGSLDAKFTIVKKSLGQLWRSLGNMILAASEGGNRHDEIMPHVLDIIAQMHHVGLMPDSVYTYRSLTQKYALQQPPTLHLLSSQILTALSDATWKAHEASLKAAKKDVKTSYLTGKEIPGSRYKVTVSAVAPELWLELVLWSTLHGGWTQDGAAILSSMANMKGSQSWGLISWREVMEAEQQNSPAPSRAWNLFSAKTDELPSAADRARTRRTISGEVVTAFVDAIVSDIRVAVGARGVEPDTVLQQLKTLKGFLDANNLSLGSIAWTSIMARLLESGGFRPERRPQFLLRIFELATGFASEVSTANTSATANTEVPYFFEPTALPLNILHQAMQAFIVNGDIRGAMTTFRLLQQHTDENKQKSLEQFFNNLPTMTSSRKDDLSTSHVRPIEFPAFETNLPIPLRAKLLELATEAKEYELARWILFAQDLDGPIIDRDLYRHRQVAASIVRFGALTGDNDLVVRMVRIVSNWNEKHQQQQMPPDILIALFCSQIRLHRWNSVRSMQEYVADVSSFKPEPVVLVTFCAELVRISKESEEDLFAAQETFADLLFGWEKRFLQHMRLELYSILSIMSTVDSGWKTFCSRFLTQSRRQNIKLATPDFNHLLEGILDAYGSAQGEAMVKQWCHQSRNIFAPYRAPGGLSTMPRYYTGKAEQYKYCPDNIELKQESGAVWTLSGRIQPNRQTIWAILRKAREEEQRSSSDMAVAGNDSKIRGTLLWATDMLHALGYDYEDISTNIDSNLSELAGLKEMVAVPRHGLLDDSVDIAA